MTSRERLAAVLASARRDGYPSVSVRVSDLAAVLEAPSVAGECVEIHGRDCVVTVVADDRESLRQFATSGVLYQRVRVTVEEEEK